MSAAPGNGDEEEEENGEEEEEEELPEDEELEEFEEELPDDWDEMTEEEQLEWWEDFQAEEDDDDELQIDAEIEDDGAESGPFVVEGDPLAIEDELERVESSGDAWQRPASEAITIAGIEIPGAYEYRRSGQGRESQYLEETSTGGGADADYGGDPWEGDLEDGGGGGEGGFDGGEEGEFGGEEPPETITIHAHCGYQTMEELRGLRTRDDTFEVIIGDETLEDMELIDVAPELHGDQPYAVDVEIEVREWREYEVPDLQSGSGAGDSGDYGGDPWEGDIDPSGTPDDPNSIDLEEDEVRPASLGNGETLRNVDVDASEDGAAFPIEADGADWRITDVGVAGDPENNPQIAASTPEGSTGRIDNLFLNGDGVMADGSGNYDVITVTSQEVFHVGSNETFSNVIFDQTAPGANAQLTARGSTNWTVENVGWRGPASGQTRAFTCSDEGNGESVARNLYIGDGTDSNSGRYPQLGIWVAPSHNGHIEFQHIYVEGARDNAIYASAPGSNSNGQRGTVAIRNCYTKNNWVSHYRLAGGVVENCVAVNDGSPIGRNLWVWPGRGGLDVTVRNCHFLCGDYAHGYDFGRSGQTTRATVIDTDYAPASSTRFQGDVQLTEENVGHNPQDFIPDGCPTSPEMAASGGGVDGPTPIGEAGQPDWPDPPDYDGPMPPPAIYVDPDKHRGNIVIDNVHIRGYSGGGIHSNLPDSSSGNVDIRNAYIRDNEGFNVQIGKPGDE